MSSQVLITFALLAVAARWVQLRCHVLCSDRALAPGSQCECSHSVWLSTHLAQPAATWQSTYANSSDCCTQRGNVRVEELRVSISSNTNSKIRLHMLQITVLFVFKGADSQMQNDLPLLELINANSEV